MAEQKRALTALSRQVVSQLELRRSVADMLRVIRERRAAEEELDQFFTLSLDMLCISDFEGQFKRVNPAWEHVLGIPTKELLSKPYIEFVHPDDVQATIREAKRIDEGATAISFENRYRCADGSYKWLLWNATPNMNQKLVYAVARDITQRKQIERLHATGYAVTRVLAEAESLEAASPLILMSICEGLGWELGALWRVNESEKAFALHESLACAAPKFSALSRRRRGRLRLRERRGATRLGLGNGATGVDAGRPEGKKFSAACDCDRRGTSRRVCISNSLRRAGDGRNRVLQP